MGGTDCLALAMVFPQSEELEWIPILLGLDIRVAHF
jgi:hypothetical protein